MSIDMSQVDHLVQIDEIYDGWSIAVMKDGTLKNRWNEEEYPRRFQRTQEVIDRQKEK